jgi:hypothetical protein
MSNNDRRPIMARHEGIECFLDDPLAISIESRCGFIKEEDLGVLNESARDCNSLLLSS